MRASWPPQTARQHLIMAGLLLLLVWLGPGPGEAHIQDSAQPDLQADQICDAIPDRLSASEIETLREQIVLFAPVRYSDLARQVRIVNDDATGGFGPYSTPAEGGEPPTIHIPIHFRSIQCRLTVATLLYSAMRRLGDAPEWASFSASGYMTRCNPQQTGLVECLNRLGDDLTPDAEGGLSQALMNMFERASEDAFLHIVLHEFAHLALGHQISGDRQEYAADTFATLRMALSRRSQTGAFAAYSGLSASDPYVHGAHGSFACRARIVHLVQTSLAPLASASLTWSIERAADYLAQRRGPAPNASIFTIMGDASGCPPGREAFIEPLRRDLQALIDVLDAESANTASTLPRQIDRLLALRPLTEEGKMFRMSIVSERIWGSTVNDDSLGSLRIHLPLVERVLSARDSSYMRSSDYGRFTAMAAIMTYDLAPANSVLVEMDAALRRRLERAILFHPRFAVARLHLGLLAYRQGRCAVGRDHLLKAAEIAGSEMNTDQTVSSLLSEEARDGCAQMSARVSASWRRMRSWR